MGKLIVTAALIGLLLACTPHRIEIQQGNIVSKERLALVKPGMDEQQVRFALGTPLITDPFHPERWDYFYSRKADGELKTTYRVTLFFDNGKLARTEEQGPVPANEREAIESITRNSREPRK